MSSPLSAPLSPFRISPARMASVAFTVFVLAVAHGAYITYCVLPRIYEATAKIQIVQPRESDGGQELSGSHQNEFELITSPDVLSPIITDLQLDKAWAKRFRSALDQLPMQDALAYLNSILRLESQHGSDVISITVFCEVPIEASGIANAVAERYQYYRQTGVDQFFNYRQSVLNDEIAKQKKIVAEKASAIDNLRAQLEPAGIYIGPGVAGLIAADLAAQKSAPAKIDALAPLRAAQAELDAQQRALDDLLLRQRQEQTDHRLAPDPVTIISLADPPERPALPKVSLNLTVAMVEGLMLAVAAAVLTELAVWYYVRQQPPAPPSSVPNSAGLASAEY